MLGRSYATCNCDSCCCGAMPASRAMSPSRTPNCASHVTLAPTTASSQRFPFTNGVTHLNAADCMGCRACASHCPRQAIFQQRDPAKGEPLEIRTLLQNAAASLLT